MFIKSISKDLDLYLEGGLHKGSITQVYGESGCGKSQLAMLFAIGVNISQYLGHNKRNPLLLFVNLERIELESLHFDSLQLRQ